MKETYGRRMRLDRQDAGALRQRCGKDPDDGRTKDGKKHNIWGFP